MARSSLQTHPVDTNLVIIYPVDREGNRLLPRAVRDAEREGRGQKLQENYPDAQIITVDSERIVVTTSGTLIEKWKADHVLDSLAYRHMWTADALHNAGMDTSIHEYASKVGQTMDQCKFAVREPTLEELGALTAPINDGEYKRVAALTANYARLAAEHGIEIQTAMRANPETSVEKLFKAFEYAFLSNSAENK